ncbi:MAG TPA: UDP-N-acetylmuramoyl-L-alanine--D-glutamate ligase [Chthoniobacterales bacterium]
MNVRAKKIAVLGLGRSGESAARFLRDRGAVVTLLDSGAGEAIERKAAEIAKAGFNVIVGPAALTAWGAFDHVVISPGIDAGEPFVRQFSDRGIPIIGELELAFEFNDLPVVAITGTNGKTTTTELVAAMLNSVGVDAIACGNIGLPFTEVVHTPPRELDVITLEVSSFQLETIKTFRPKVAVWLNLTPDHLDRYPGMADYRTAKLRVFENQTSEDFAVVNARDELPSLAAKKITFSAFIQKADFTLRDGVIYYQGKRIAAVSSFHLSGVHNIENLMAALGVALALEIPFVEVLPALQAYKPAPHRCELVATVDGVDYINDSKATNVDALAKALDSQGTPVVLIAGGKDKGFRFADLTELVGTKVKRAILIGEMAGRIREDWQGAVACEVADSLVDAVGRARKAAVPGDVVLFSPGTSSFDMFRDYADRGNQFRKLANNLLT